MKETMSFDNLNAIRETATTTRVFFGLFSGITDPETIQNTALSFILASVILNVVSFIAGFDHKLNKM